MRWYRELHLWVCLVPLFACGCGGRAESKAPTPVNRLTSMGMQNVQARCSANKLTTTGKYSMRGHDGEMVLLVDDQERARLPLKEAGDVPFILECTGVGRGEHEWRLVFEGTVMVERPNGEVEKETIHARMWGPSKVMCE